MSTSFVVRDFSAVIFYTHVFMITVSVLKCSLSVEKCVPTSIYWFDGVGVATSGWTAHSRDRTLHVHVGPYNCCNYAFITL